MFIYVDAPLLVLFNYINSIKSKNYFAVKLLSNREVGRFKNT